MTPDALRARFAAESRAFNRVRGDHELNGGSQPSRRAVPAAVLIPLVGRAEGVTVLLTRRTDDLQHHAGQISFPGGQVEAADASPADTALRETEEEVGLARGHVEILGHLDPYVTRTGFSITPIVGIVAPPFALRPDPREVAEVFEAPLEFFLDPANHRRQRIRFQGEVREFYAMPWRDYFIWGATAGMMRNLYEHLVRP